MAIIKKSAVKSAIRVDASIASTLGLEEGDVVECVLKSYQPAKSGCMIILEFEEADKTYSIMTWSAIDMATLTSKLGGRAEATCRGIKGDYCNFAVQFHK